MDKRLKQQGNQAGKLLPEVYEALKAGGAVPKLIYTVNLDENNTVLMNAGVDITVTAKALNTSYDAIKVITNDGTEYSLIKTAIFDSSAVFNAVMSLNTTLAMIVGYVTSDSIHIQTCDLPLSTNIAVHLDIGDLQEVKDNNLSALKSTQGHFFANIDYGYGVGTYKAGIGGFVHVTTAYGNEVFYSIKADGSITREDDYIKPNEPYTVHIEAEKIGIELGDILASKVQNAGELIVTGSTGMITYTRAADSTDSAIYFTDNRKDGKLAVLTYTTSNKTITDSIV